MPANPQPMTARKRLELSQIKPGTIQRGLMGDDIDLEKLAVYLKSIILFDSIDRIVDAKVTRAIDSASTIELTLNDYDKSILRSGALNALLDIQIDGMWFRLVKVSRGQGDDNISLTFEQREVALLRLYPKPYAPHNGVKIAHRSKVTRAEFILNLIREVSEVNIPVVIPSLHKVQPIQKKVDGSTGINWDKQVASVNPGLAAEINAEKANDASDAGAQISGNEHKIPQKFLTAKGAPLTNEKMRNANIILQTGITMGVKTKLLVCAIMTAIAESVLINRTDGDGTSVGLFQQQDMWGSYSDRHDPATASRMFYNHAIKADKQWPDVDHNTLCQLVQGSSTPYVYGKYFGEAVRIVTAYGIPLGKGGKELDASDANNQGNNTYGGTEDFVYYRGDPGSGGKTWKREDSWTCIQRLADDVGWRAFFIGGVFYYVTDDQLFKMQPIATITESTTGVISIGFDYDIGKKGATVDVSALTGRWAAPPGAVVLIDEMGPITGRWLVNSFERSLFDLQADITLTKPLPKLPEPYDDSVSTLPGWAQVPVATGEKPLPPAQFGGDPSMNDGSRNAVVAVAKRALEVEQKWHYDYAHAWETGIHAPRPIPDSLWSKDAHQGIDCSSFATLCYKEANCDDPNGPKYNYNGQGYTGSLASQGIPVVTPSPADLIFYGPPPNFEHVAVYIGGGKVIQIGGDSGVRELDWNYRTVTAVRSYLPGSYGGGDVSKPPSTASSGGTTGQSPKIDVMIQAGHDTGTHDDQPYGHTGQSGAVGEQEFTQAIRSKVIALLQADPRFKPWAGTAWSASAGATSDPSDDENFKGDMFISIHYDRGTPGSGFFFGHTRGATDGRSDTVATESGKLCDLIATEINKIPGHPPRLTPDNNNFGGTPSNATGWGYYAWGSSQRAAPDNVDHTPGVNVHCVMECGRADDGDYLDNKRDEIAKAIYNAISAYYGG